MAGHPGSQRSGLFASRHEGRPWSGMIRALSLVSVLTAPALALSFGGWTQQQRQEAEALLKQTFTGEALITSSALPLMQSELDSARAKAKQPFGIDTLHLLMAARGGKVTGWAVIDNVKGKDQPITYCIIVDENLTVKDIRILAYREPYGGQVKNPSWLEQFFGKGPDDPLRPGKEIKNITGATISARSVTNGVRRALILLGIIRTRLPQTSEEDQ